MDRLKIMDNQYVRQVLLGTAAGLIMIISGAAWIYLAATRVFSQLFPSLLAGLFNDKPMYNTVIFVFFMILCGLPNAFKAHRLVKASVIYLIFPILWGFVIGIILYGKILSHEFIAPINNHTAMLIPIYGGAVLIPCTVVLTIYLKFYRDKLAEFASHAVLFTVMTLAGYMYLNTLIIICANFGECM